MAQAVTCAMEGKNKKAFNLVVITTLCAFAFLVIKYFEYSHKIHDGLFPGMGMFSYEGATGTNLKLFFTIYFVMTGLHGVHILIGIGLMFWLMKRLKNDEILICSITRVEFREKANSFSPP